MTPVFDGSNNPVRQPGKVDAVRFMTFSLEPQLDNFEDLFGKVIDPIWLEESNHPNALALREANQGNKKVRDHASNRAGFVDVVRTAVQTYLPALSAPAELTQITLFLANYYGVEH